MSTRAPAWNRQASREREHAESGWSAIGADGDARSSATAAWGAASRMASTVTASWPWQPSGRRPSGSPAHRHGSTAGHAGTLVFDEVDVGIGGRVAEIVGRMLREVGRRSQVLCVTHLPQVAAQADWQWSVAKEEVAGGVASRVRRLDGEARVEEIARMLGGATITSRTRAHAREMLGMAAQAQLSS